MATPAKKPAKKTAKPAAKKAVAPVVRKTPTKSSKAAKPAAKSPTAAPKAAKKVAAPAKAVSKATRAPAKAATKGAPVKAATKAVPVKASLPAVKPWTSKESGPAIKPLGLPVRPTAPPLRDPNAKPKKSPFSPKELQSIKEALIQHRALLEKEAADLNAGTFDTSQSELSGEVSFDEEYADAGTFTFERERDLSLGNNIRDLMDKVTAALQKIDRGQYGICERCGEAINKDRMKALPYSVLCIRCKQIEERQR